VENRPKKPASASKKSLGAVKDDHDDHDNNVDTTRKPPTKRSKYNPDNDNNNDDDDEDAKIIKILTSANTTSSAVGKRKRTVSKKIRFSLGDEEGFSDGDGEDEAVLPSRRSTPKNRKSRGKDEVDEENDHQLADIVEEDDEDDHQAPSKKRSKIVVRQKLSATSSLLEMINVLIIFVCIE
jgi:hypothetical protein